MRMTASWSGSNNPTAYKSVARRCDQWRAPLGSSTDRQGTPDAEAMQKAPVAGHHRSACSGIKALRNTSPAKRPAAKLCYRFGPLTPSARSANLIAGDGTENGFPAPNKELVTIPKQLLDRKSPIQVRIHFPPAESPSLARIRFRRHQRCRCGATNRIVDSPDRQARHAHRHREGYCFSRVGR